MSDFFKTKYRVRKLTNGNFVAESKSFLTGYNTLTYARKSQKINQWIPTEFSKKEFAQFILDRYKNIMEIQNEQRDKNEYIEKEVTGPIFLDEEDISSLYYKELENNKKLKDISLDNMEENINLSILNLENEKIEIMDLLDDDEKIIVITYFNEMVSNLLELKNEDEVSNEIYLDVILENEKIKDRINKEVDLLIDTAFER